MEQSGGGDELLEVRMSVVRKADVGRDDGLPRSARNYRQGLKITPFRKLTIEHSLQIIGGRVGRQVRVLAAGGLIRPRDAFSGGREVVRVGLQKKPPTLAREKTATEGCSRGKVWRGRQSDRRSYNKASDLAMALHGIMRAPARDDNRGKIPAC